MSFVVAMKFFERVKVDASLKQEVVTATDGKIETEELASYVLVGAKYGYKFTSDDARIASITSMWKLDDYSLVRAFQHFDKVQSALPEILSDFETTLEEMRSEL